MTRRVGVAAAIIGSLALAACAGGDPATSVVNNHYDSLSNEERSTSCELWQMDTATHAQVVDLEMVFAPSWPGADEIPSSDLRDAIFGWYEGNC